MPEAVHKLNPAAKTEVVRSRPSPAESWEAEHSFLNLQRTMGNQGVARLFRSPAESSEAASGGARSLGEYLPLSGPMAAFAGTNIQPVAGLAGDHQARAQARDGGIEMDAAMSGAPAGEVRALLAHETVHLAQQT